MGSELLQVRAGHASFQQTYEIYVHPSLAALRTAWEKTQDQVCLTSAQRGRESHAKHPPQTW